MKPDREATCAWDCTLPEGHDGPCGRANTVNGAAEGRSRAVPPAVPSAVADLIAYGQAESTNALKAKDREQYQFWQGWLSALYRVKSTGEPAESRAVLPESPYSLEEIMAAAETDVLRARAMFNAGVGFGRSPDTDTAPSPSE